MQWRIFSGQTGSVFEVLCFIRHYEIPEFIRILSPVYIKFGLRNHPDVYPSGKHLEQVNIGLSRERVRQAYMRLQLLKQYAPELTTSELGAPGLAVPVPQK